MASALGPDVRLYACAGALIGALAALTAPGMKFSTAITLHSPSLFSLAPDASTDVAPAWSENMQDIVDAALGPRVRTVTLRAGDTLGDVLARAGIPRGAAQSVVDAIHDVFNPKRLQAGQELDLAYDALVAEGDTPALTRVDFSVDPSRSISVERQEDGSFTAKALIAQTHREFARIEGTIKSSLYEAAKANDLPMDVLTDMVKLFSYDVDFQRDVQKGDQFAVLYERTATDDGTAVRNLTITYAAMVLSGSPLKFYAFRQEDGSYEYYNEKGEGIRKALLRTPVNGAVLTSRFGLRLHPILGYSLMHRGVDFGAPQGTPIVAAGDGVIEQRGPHAGYGNYVRIRHNSDYATAYGHMSRFAPGIAVGKRVRQGQIIGYVGSTGRATGPHLHYEVYRGRAQVNPINVKFPSAQKLLGATLATFMETKANAEHLFANAAASGVVLAEDARGVMSARN